MTRRLHAEHNKKLCQKLLEDKNFNDWVVTTAFYSAIHFTQHQIFPLEVGEDEFESLSAYYNSLDPKTRKSKHEEQYKLIKNHIKSIHAHYKLLMDASSTARYNSYFVTEAKAKDARLKLTLIEAAITKA